MVDILLKYEGWNQEQDNLGDSMIKFEAIIDILNEIDMTQLLDDHHHYRDNHDDERNIYISTRNLPK